MIRQSLTEWEQRPNCERPEYLSTVLGDLVKASRASPVISRGDAKVNGWLTVMDTPEPPNRKELT